MESGQISAQQIKASSQYNSNWSPERSRLNYHENGWTPSDDTVREWIQVSRRCFLERSSPGKGVAIYYAPTSAAVPPWSLAPPQKLGFLGQILGRGAPLGAQEAFGVWVQGRSLTVLPSGDTDTNNLHHRKNPSLLIQKHFY